MKGKIRKSNRGWVVDQVVKEGLQARLINTYPLHLYDIQKIEEQEKVFDNIEARIAAYPDVHFEIVTDFDNNGPEHFPKFARIIASEEDKMVTKCYCGHTSYCDCGPLPEEAELKDWDVTLNDGLENEPYISDDFQIGPDGAYEHTEEWNTLPKEKASELVDKFSNECLLTTDGGKVAALIAVDEIKRILYDQDSMTRYDYWFEVKKEINKIRKNNKNEQPR